MAGFAGFDRSEFPGLPVMAWLKANTNLAWCGYYLAPAPSHRGRSWMGRRGALMGQGWGLAPIHVGQQVTGRGSHRVTPVQGARDGREADQLMAREGFKAGSCVYLDLENGPPLLKVQREYLAGWVEAVREGGFLPGVYCSHSLAGAVHRLHPVSRIWAFKVGSSHPHPVPGNHFPDDHPAGSGYPGAYAWQLAQNCRISVPPAPASTLLVDLDSAVAPDPCAG